MSEAVSSIIALVIGGLIGLVMGVTIAGDLTQEWIKAGAFQRDGVAYRVGRITPLFAEGCTRHPVSEASK